MNEKGVEAMNTYELKTKRKHSDWKNNLMAQKKYEKLITKKTIVEFITNNINRNKEQH